MKRHWRIAGINFDHFHMGDLLRQVSEHPQAELVGICDRLPERMREAKQRFGLGDAQVFTDEAQCMEQCRPDIVILCPAANEHGEWVARIAPYGAHILMEKPFAGNLAQADAMIAAMPKGSVLAVNWPLVWDAGQQQVHALIRRGRIGEVLEFQHYGGNRGPLYHGADKTEHQPSAAEKADSWFYRAAQGGGSLLDYMGYGATLGSWHLGNQVPLSVNCSWHIPTGLEVDEHAIAVIAYAHGLSRSETRWGTFTDPWTHQPQPKCGFVIRGSMGTLSCYDYETFVTLQDRDHPQGLRLEAPAVQAPCRNPIENLIHHLETGAPLIGPLTLETSRLGQRIVDTAFQSAQAGRSLPLLP